MKASFCWLVIITIIWVLQITKVEEKREKIVVVKETIKVKIKTREEIQVPPKTVIDFAEENLGKPYVYGTKGPESFDCSGFVYAMYRKMGINIPRNSLTQSNIEGEKIPKELLEKGDLVFFDTSLKGKVNHSGIYLGDAKFIHASSGQANAVTISSLDDWYKDKFKWGKRLNANK